MKVTECRGADARAVAEAVEVLKQGKIIIYPTDTVYALGCDALNARAVERLCRIKGLNPEKNLLSIVCADISQAAEYTRIDNRAFAVLKHNFPGPYTFILPAATKLPKVFRGRKSVGVRVPDNEFARALAESLGNPVMTSSVNTENIDAFEDLDVSVIVDEYSGLNDISLALDGGVTCHGLSTIVNLTDSDTPELVRQGVGSIEF